MRYFSIIGQDEIEPSTLVFLFAVLVGFTILLVLMLVFFLIGRHWMKAFLSRTPVSMFQIIGMILRRANTQKIIDTAIACQQAGHPISIADLERADLEGLDIEAISLTYRTARDKGKLFSMEELIKAARESKLEKLLNS